MIQRAWRRLTAYFAHPDPRVALGNTVALIVVGNQPFYPFYVWYVAGALVPAAFLTWLSTPLFAASPAIGRRAPGAGRGVLIAAAIGNTTLSTLALGPASGVELFYLPSLLLAGAVFPGGRRAGPVTAALAAIALGFGAGRLVAPISALTEAQSHGLAVMHAVSVACLLVLIAVQASRIADAPVTLTRRGP